MMSLMLTREVREGLLIGQARIRIFACCIVVARCLARFDGLCLRRGRVYDLFDMMPCNYGSEYCSEIINFAIPSIHVPLAYPPYFYLYLSPCPDIPYFPSPSISLSNHHNLSSPISYFKTNTNIQSYNVNLV